MRSTEKMKSKYTRWALGAVLVLAAAGIVYGQARRHHEGGWGMHGDMMGGPMMGGRMLGHVARYLDLSEAQKAQIKTMWQAEKPATMPLIQQLANGRKQMLALTGNGTFDQAKVQTLATQQAQTLVQLMVTKERLQSEIYNKVLTPEQRTKADAMRQKQSQRIDAWLQHLANPGTTPAKPSE
jgi:Spy/CpxP family protein refolding chaperone